MQALLSLERGVCSKTLCEQRIPNVGRKVPQDCQPRSSQRPVGRASVVQALLNSVCADCDCVPIEVVVTVRPQRTYPLPEGFLSASPQTLARTKEFNRHVHGARGLFSSAVYVFHVVNSGLATYALLATPVAQFFTRTTEFGVEAFFCISGFVIAGTLRRARGPGVFLIDRMIRIFPVLWATVLTISVLGFVTRTHGFQYLSFAGYLTWLPFNLAALPGVFSIPLYHPAAWSLSYEAMFYLACAAGWWLVTRRGIGVLVIGIPLAALAIAFYPRAVFFLAGVIVAEGLLDHRLPAALTRFPVMLLALFLCAWRGVQMLSRPSPLTTSTMFEWVHDARLPLAILAFVAAALGFAGLATGRGLLGRFLRLPIMQYLGTISYSFYLWHPIVMSGVKHEMIVSGLARAVGSSAQMVFFLLALPPSLIAAHYSQLLLERALAMRLRRRLHHPAPLAARAGGPAPIGLGVDPGTVILGEASAVVGNVVDP